MKREIKFRAKSIIKGEEKWVYGHYSEGSPDFHYISNRDGSVWPINPDTLGQFTGLLNKNGKEIYEGDILSSKYYVKWNPLHCGWALFNRQELALLADEYDIDGNALDQWQINDEVIGNIYENSELLKMEL